MKRILLLLFIIVHLLFTFLSCNKDRLSYYDKPDWLEGPLFEQIKASGEFNEFVKAAELTGYDEFLSSRLTFTVFVPTDAAFEEFYQERNISSVEDMDKDELLSLLQYHTMQNSWDSLKMTGKTSFGWWNDIPDNFRTPSIYTPPIEYVDGKNVVYDNTFFHIFSKAFFDKNGYSDVDYETFFPGSQRTDFNIDRAAILENEIGAENGFYYKIDKVLNPRTTADKVIAEIPEFSLFKTLIDRFITYNYNATSSQNNIEYDSLFKRKYALNFDLANEKIADNAYDGYYHVFNTMFIPSNQQIESYFAEKFPAYPTIESVPNIIVKYFVEAHMVPNKKLFPTVLSRADNERNDFSDEILFDLDNGIQSANISSNAIIYGVDEVIETNAFSTVSGPIIRDPNYKIFTLLLELSGEIRSFFKYEINHIVFVLSDTKMTELGFAYDEGDPIDFTDDKIFRNNNAMTIDEIKAFLQNFISITSKEVNGSNEAFIKTKNNKFLHISGNTVEGLFGTAEILEQYPSINGTVLEIDNDLSQGTNYSVENYLNDNKETFGQFFALCDSAGMLNNEGLLEKLSLFSGITVLLPTDEAVQAIIGSYIPPGATSSTFNYRQLIQYQVISERVMFTDDEFIEGDYGTDLFIGGQRYKITVEAADGIIDLTDLNDNHYQITTGPQSNIITSSGIIHIVPQVSLF
ncbi:MAG: fasciclin domain-containing protein [Saprospiraceae bacterium]|nr:fasciclin domain-containing protein [Saprospiraceae bacterium]MCB9323988.1 fasciclin domain-containing protein [Lewinellaceae bacterium]